MKRKYIQKISTDFPKISTEQMIEVDHLMIEEYHIELIQMMENAGRCLAIVAREIFLAGNPENKKIAVLAGTGGNGGGALVSARRLSNWGAKVDVYMTADRERMRPIPRHQQRILEKMNISIKSGKELPQHHNYDLLIDGIIGYSVKGNPSGLAGEMIHWLNENASPVLSLDTPSGLDLTTGTIHYPSVKANATLTLAMPKKGLFEEAAKTIIGNLYLGDISVPPQLYAVPSLGLEVGNLFRDSDILQIY